MFDRQSIDRHFGNHLKPHSTTNIEDAIAEAISLLTGHGYDCRILKIDFTEGTRHTGAHLDLKLIRNAKKDDDSLKSDYEREQDRDDDTGGKKSA
jgi:hypothetical protein